ncbi:hypothetical protein ACED56_12335 [Vibrio splendidus]|uniref:hypothetical protein n=1 Tax=Vibrio splendidus TaxID=29497 RepID=UPI00352D340F
MKRYQKYLSLLLVLVAFNSNALQCSAGKVEVDGVCVSSCKILQGTGKNLTWDAYIWGDNPRSYCIGDRSTGAACRMTAGSVSISIEGNKWTNKFTYTGSTCAFDEINRFSGDTPEPFPFENDVNQNGVNDDFEDWDGDGIPNGQDPDPYKSDKVLVDNNDNGVPDSIDDFYDRLTDVNKPVFCNSDDEDCLSYRSSMSDLTDSNAVLSGALRDLSLRSVRRTDFRESIGTLVTTINKNDGYFKTKLDALSLAQGNTQSSILNELTDTKYSVKSAVEGGFFVLNRNLDDVDENVLRSINATRDAKDDILRAVNNSSGGGLTSKQERQLRDASKARNNEAKLNDIKNYTSDTNRSISQVKDQVNTTLGAVASQAGRFSNLEGKISSLDGRFDTVDGQFSQLSDQIAAISGGQSTVDLSGVESSISDLSAKIDGLEVGDMSGVEGKIDDLIKGISNNNDFVEPSSGFNGEGFIVTQNQIADVQNEVLEIKQEMTDEFEKFKALFSIDTSSFNNGTYKEHSLNLNVNHAERSFKSGVLSALLENATIISAVVMFLFVLSGIRMLGKD